MLLGEALNRKVSPPAEHRYRCSLPGLAGFAGQRWQDRNPVYTVNIRAERAGFEPAVPLGTHDFQSCTFGLSVTSPLIYLVVRVNLSQA